MLDQVEAGELDLSFAVLPLRPGPFQSIELMRDPHLLMVAADSPLAVLRRVRPAVLAGLPLVGFHSLAGYGPVEAYLRTQGVEPRFILRSDDNGIVQGFVAAGIGAAVVPSLAVDRRDDSVRAIPITGMPPRVLALAWHRDRYRSPAAQEFAVLAARYCRNLKAEA